jgi:hypothetical protein
MHFKSGMPIAFLVDRFRIDDLRNGEPMNVATVSRDLSTQKTAEAEMRHLNESLEQRVEQRTIELEEEHKKLLAENFEREQADVRFQKLRNGLFRASPQPVRWRPRSHTNLPGRSRQLSTRSTQQGGCCIARIGPASR